MKDHQSSALFGMMLGLALGVLVTIPAVGLAIASGGMGHGHYSFARLLYPGPLLLTRLTGNSITPPLAALACVQFPLYGAAVGFSSPWRPRCLVVAGILLVNHAAVVCACFNGFIPNFS